MFTREELWKIQSKACRDRAAVLNPDWIQAYNNLIFACSVLDAFIARSTISVSEESIQHSPYPPIPLTIQGEGKPITPSEEPGYQGGCCGGGPEDFGGEDQPSCGCRH